MTGSVVNNIFSKHRPMILNVFQQLYTYPKMGASLELSRGYFKVKKSLKPYKFTAKDTYKMDKLFKKLSKKDIRRQILSISDLLDIGPMVEGPARNTATRTDRRKQAWAHPRASQLSSIFMEYISDLIASGEACRELVPHNIELTKITISHGFHTLHVHWLARGGRRDEAIDRLLPYAATRLRTILSQLQIMGRVPAIQFVKDKQWEMHAEIDRRLRVADFGPEPGSPEEQHPPSGGPTAPRQEPRWGEAAPEFSDTNDVYGVNHTALMEKILTRRASRPGVGVTGDVTDSLASHPHDDHDSAAGIEVMGDDVQEAVREGAESEEAFERFLKHRKLEKLRKKDIKKARFANDDSCTGEDSRSDLDDYQDFDDAEDLLGRDFDEHGTD